MLRNISLTPFVLVFLIGGSFPGQPLNAQTIPSPFIFNTEHQQEISTDISAIHHIMGQYYKGVEKANLDLLREVFHPTWFMRDTDTPEESYLNVESKKAFIKRVRDHGPYQNYARDRAFAGIDKAYDNLAFVRINKNPSRNSTGFFLFKLQGEWTITDKIFVNPRPQLEQVSPSGKSYAIVESLVHDYFQSLASADTIKLRGLLHEKWDLKYLDEAGSLQTLSKSEFLKRLPNNKAFYDHSQLMTIDMYHGKLALVRLDMPAQSMTSFFTLFKIAGTWKIVSERKTQGVK